MGIVAMPAYGWIFPCFGVLLSGLAGAACWTITFAFCLVLARGTCRGEPWAWWTAAVGCVAAAVSCILTFAGTAPDAVFEAMSLSADLTQMMERFWPRSPWAHVALWLAVWGSLLAYLVAVRRLFEPSD